MHTGVLYVGQAADVVSAGQSQVVPADTKAATDDGKQKHQCHVCDKVFFISQPAKPTHPHIHWWEAIPL